MSPRTRSKRCLVNDGIIAWGEVIRYTLLVILDEFWAYFLVDRINPS